MPLEDFLAKDKNSSPLDEEFEQSQNYVDAETAPIPDEFQEDEAPEINHQEAPPRQHKEYDDWLNPKLTKDELLAKAEMEAFKYGAIITGSLTMVYSLMGIMPQPLTPGEMQLYDDFILERGKAKKRGETYYVDEDDPINLIYARKIEYDQYGKEAKLDKEQMAILKRAIFQTLHGKNERGQLGQMSISGAVMTIALAKAAPRLSQFIPLIVKYVKNGIDKVRNHE